MSDFTGFSEHAKLYAAHEAVVNAMYRRLQDDCIGFWQAVADSLADSFAPAGIQSDKLTAGARYSYIRIVTSVPEELASVWILREDSKLVCEGDVHLGFGLPRAGGNVLVLQDAVATSKRISTLGQVLLKPKPSATTLFEFKAKLDKEKIVSSAMSLIEPVLSDLVEIAQRK